jgi:thiol-disulfide isomerase/thioredoxin
MTSGRPKSVHIVYASWCPHCVPTTVEPLQRAADGLGMQFELHDIDTDDVERADELVRKYGDWTEDYIIPQVFLEFEDGSIKHVLTGYPEGVAYTRRAVENLLSSDWFSPPGRTPGDG